MCLAHAYRDLVDHYLALALNGRILSAVKRGSVILIGTHVAIHSELQTAGDA